MSEPAGFAHQAGRRNSLAAGMGVRAANPGAKVGELARKAGEFAHEKDHLAREADDFTRRPVTLAQRSYDQGCAPLDW